MPQLLSLCWAEWSGSMINDSTMSSDTSLLQYPIPPHMFQCEGGN